MDGMPTTLSHHSRAVNTTAVVAAVVVVVVPFRNSKGPYDPSRWEYTNHSMSVVRHTMVASSLWR